MKKTIAYATVLALFLLLLPPLLAPAEDAGEWKEAKLKLVVCKNEKEALKFMTAAFRKEKIFYDESRHCWLDEEKDSKNPYYSDMDIAFPTRSTKHRGVWVHRDSCKSAGIEVDTNGDDKLDTKITKSGAVVKIRARYPDGEKALAVLFLCDAVDHWDGTKRFHWTYSRAYYWEGKIAGKPIYFFDENVDGYINVIGSDGVVVGKGPWGSYMSTIVLVKNKLYEIEVDERGEKFRYRPYVGPKTKVDFKSKFKGPMKPRFVVLRTPFDTKRPDPRSVSILLPAGVGVVPEALYDFKWTMLSDRCIGRDHTREDQWIDDTCLPYLMKGKEKWYFPTKPKQIRATGDKLPPIEWGAPFCIHPRPYHQTDDGGAKVDNLAFGAWDFLFFDSSGVCFFTPKEMEVDGAAIPEEMMFEIIVYDPKTGKPVTRNTRYTKGSGGGVGDASPDWVLFQVPLNGRRGVFKIEIRTKTKHFGKIDCFCDFKLEK